MLGALGMSLRADPAFPLSCINGGGKLQLGMGLSRILETWIRLLWVKMLDLGLGGH